MTTSRASLPFTSVDAFATLEAACLEAGILSDGAQLIRMGENGLFSLGHDRIVVRIARSSDVLKDAEKEVAVAAWLRENGLPAAETTDHNQPLMVRGRPVTFWKLIDDSGARPSLADLARILRRVHGLEVPDSLPLPKFNIFDRVSERIVKASELPAAEREFLDGRLGRLRREYAALDFALPSSAVHGDAHQSNLIQTPTGEVILIDFERFAYGPPESDLAMTATEHLIGWHTDAEYDRFCEVYGFDVEDWPGFPVIRAVNELKMTTWLMQNVGESDRVALEFRTRLASLHDDDAPRDWQPF
jgi:thiamine kinase-like enzyme